MKVKDLLVRREQLKQQKASILKQINELTANMERKDLEKFIQTGDAEQVDGHQLDKLQRKRKHLTLLGGSLDKEIVQASQKERKKQIASLEKYKLEGKDRPGTIEIDTHTRLIKLTWQQFEKACEIFNRYSDSREIGPSRPEAKQLERYFCQAWHSQDQEKQRSSHQEAPNL